jgi:hypothetical protein
MANNKIETVVGSALGPMGDVPSRVVRDARGVWVIFPVGEVDGQPVTVRRKVKDELAVLSDEQILAFVSKTHDGPAVS